ncbi:glycosyl transferase family 1 [Sphingomonas aerolata]|uniref:Glycosyl transferase family 1 n=1 Tax=Sphingomonas aerolata TaxID=185951 RepID=A0A2T4YRD4_9SPHN|nr:glycosyltransferase [Sphingomonas aerolata]PTM46083.1 glycosyl transferase family 1 [Sphingomonas aerolata]
MSDLLFLAHRVPFPPDRGDKIRSFHVLRYLGARMRVHLVAFADDAADRDPPVAFTDMLASCTILPRGKSQARAGLEALATGKPVSLTAFASPAMQAAVDRVLPRVDGIYCFSGQMAQYLPDEGPRVVMDFVDMDSAKFAGFADDSRGPMRWMMRREARLLGAFEQEIAARVSASLFVSEAEATLFRTGGATGRILAVENGIDSATFDPAGQAGNAGKAGRAGQAAPPSHHPGEGRGPVGKVAVTTDSPSLSTSPNWTPASAGEVKGRANGATGHVLAVENGIDSTTFDPAAYTGQAATPFHHPGEGRGPVGKAAVTPDSPSPSTSPNWTPASVGEVKSKAVLSEAHADPLIVFTGQMDYRPNIDAVTWFARDILPTILTRHPTARFAIVGRAPTPAVQALAGDAVIVTGAVDDVRGWLAAADVCVAPLKLARGIQNKVLEAMAMARPVVASAAAAEGIDHAGTIRVAADASEFAAQLLALFDAPTDAAELGRAARAQVLRRYGWDARLAPLDALFGVEGSGRTPS